MPRSHRLDIANGVHHVTARGLERRNIVFDDDDRSHWWRLLERVARRYRWRVFAEWPSLLQAVCAAQETTEKASIQNPT